MGERSPVQEEDYPRFFLKGGKRVRGGVRWGNGQGRDQPGVVEWEGGSALQQRKGPVGDLVDWEVLSNSCPRRFPHEGAEGWVQLH